MRLAHYIYYTDTNRHQRKTAVYHVPSSATKGEKCHLEILKPILRMIKIHVFKFPGNLLPVQGYFRFPKVAVGNEIHNQGSSFTFPLVT